MRANGPADTEADPGRPPQHHRSNSYPFMLSSRRKPRRVPLVFRFVKGAVHGAILVPVLWHAIFTTVVVVLNKFVYDRLGLPSSIIPALSIVVGLMLVFRNQTSYNRFWDGRNGVQTIHTSVRNLIRVILTNSYTTNGPPTAEEQQDIEQTVCYLMAIPYAVKNHLRAEWGAASIDPEGVYARLPATLRSLEEDGLGLPFQLTFFVDGFIKRGVDRGWFTAPGASQLQGQLNALTDALGKLETIRITPIPVAYLIHQKQVLALFGCVLPFAMVDDMGWWAIPIVTLVIFTLYGIEGIGSQLEDPFGYDRNDIKMDALCFDANIELDVVLREWRAVVAEESTAAGEERKEPYHLPPMFHRKPLSN